MKLRAGFYCGPHQHLAGRRAKVQGVERQDGQVLVQFDDPVSITTYGVPLNFGWHLFPAAHFDLDVEYE